jgi:hypothetical protein
MNKILLTAGILLASAAMSCAQKIGKIKIPKSVTTVTQSVGLSEEDIANGLKEALTKGAKMAADSLNKKDGFYGNPLVKIPFPPELAKMESTLRSMGLGKEIDKFILSLNRSAENAAIEAAPIFTSAITNIKIADAKAILQGSDTSATSYLRNATYNSLYSTFTPHIKKALDNNFVASQWTNLANAYNKLPTTRTKVNSDIVAFTTGRALKGLFVKVAEEEGKIRNDASARTSDLLKKVFGSQSK